MLVISGAELEASIEVLNSLTYWMISVAYTYSAIFLAY